MFLKKTQKLLQKLNPPKKTLHQYFQPRFSTIIPPEKTNKSEVFSPICQRDSNGFRIPIKMTDLEGRPPFVMDKNFPTTYKKLTETLKSFQKMPVNEALIQLKHHPKKNAAFVRESLSALRDEAVFNFNWDERLLRIDRMIANKARPKKHIIFKARGRTNKVQQRFTHLRIELGLMKKEPFSRFMNKPKILNNCEEIRMKGNGVKGIGVELVDDKMNMKMEEGVKRKWKLMKPKGSLYEYGKGFEKRVGGKKCSVVSQHLKGGY